MTTSHSSFERCARCRTFVWDNICRCVRFRCGVPWKDQLDPDDTHEIFALDAESAAEKFAELRDSEGDYTIIRHGSGEVWVLDESDVQTKWDIEAESVPTYHAYEKPQSAKPGVT